ncbi:MAG: ABC transporter permease [Clostridiales bacterium]|jgi:ABC-type transport system involved in multi-copper enzyme maturation permease subunit|nr:ABC transporter permease [Clostridiales bacterium]
MKSFEIKNFKSIYINELKRRKKSLIVWCAALFGITALYMLLYPMVKDMFVTQMQTFPPELMELFGMSDSSAFTDYNSYFASIAAIIIVIISAFAVSLGGGIFREEETSGSIEFTYACAVSRTELWAAKTTAAVTIVTALIVSVTLSALVCGAISASDEIKSGVIITGMLLAYLTALLFVGIGFFAACFLKKSVKPAAVGLGILFGTYLLGYLSSIGPKGLEFLKYICPFSFLSVGDFVVSSAGIGSGAYGAAGIIIAVILIPMLVFGSYIFYKKRDF